MLTKMFRTSVLLGIGPATGSRNQDKPIVGTPVLNDDTETGGERVARMFRTDEFGRMSNELNSIYQASFFGGFVGALYGGFLGSRKSYVDFMDRNQATAFENHLDAKRKLQDQVTMGFAKNAFRFGWRLALFTTSYTAISTTIAVYRGKSSFLEYIAAGTLTGTMYKFNLGLRGMFAGGVVGGVLGTIAGGATLLILRSSGMTMEEVRYWQYKWRSNRDNMINEGFRASLIGTEHNDELINSHDDKVGSKNLDIKEIIPDESSESLPAKK